jgi:hypothetical protein
VLATGVETLSKAEKPDALAAAEAPAQQQASQADSHGPSSALLGP